METVWECIGKAMAAAKEKVGEVKVMGLGITNQRETTVVWQRGTGKPLHKAIVWHDMRTQHLVDRLINKLGSSVRTFPLGVTVRSEFFKCRFHCF